MSLSMGTGKIRTTHQGESSMPWTRGAGCRRAKTANNDTFLKMLLTSFKDYKDQLRKTWKKASHDLDEDSIHDLRVASRRMGALLLLVEYVLGAVSYTHLRAHETP